MGCLAAAGAWLSGESRGWLVAGLVLGVVIPFTLVAIMATNHRLMDPALGPDLPETRSLLRRWGHLHLVRTLLGLLALAVMLRLLADT